MRLCTLHCIRFFKSKKTREGGAAAAPRTGGLLKGTQGEGGAVALAHAYTDSGVVFGSKAASWASQMAAVAPDNHVSTSSLTFCSHSGAMDVQTR